MHGRRVLVTGGAGFIGANLANHLAEHNDVLALDDESMGTADHLEDDVSFVRASVLDDDLPVEDVDVVMHLAAVSSYDLVEADPRHGTRVNVEGFVNTVTQAREAGCDRVVYASTSSMYADGREPTPVDAPISPNTAYEASKLSRERYATYLSAHYDLDVAGLRLFSVYQGYGGCESHKGGYANVISQFADDLAAGETPVLFGDGTQTRDFIHVDDVVRAFEHAADTGLDGPYNVGTGTPTSFNEIVDRLNGILGTDIEPTYAEHPMPEDVYVTHTCADCSTFRDATGWAPTVDLQDGLERVCDFYT